MLARQVPTEWSKLVCITSSGNDQHVRVAIPSQKPILCPVIGHKLVEIQSDLADTVRALENVLAHVWGWELGWTLEVTAVHSYRFLAVGAVVHNYFFENQCNLNACLPILHNFMNTNPSSRFHSPERTFRHFFHPFGRSLCYKVAPKLDSNYALWIPQESTYVETHTPPVLLAHTKFGILTTLKSCKSGD